MEDLKFLKEYRRMCHSYRVCTQCPIGKVLNRHSESKCVSGIQNYPVEVLEAIEDWRKEHPEKTNAQKFEEIFGIKPENAEPPYKERVEPNWWDEPFEGK